MLFPVWSRRTFSAIICYLSSGPTHVVAVILDIRSGVEAKTAVEDLSEKSFPCYGKVGLWVGLELG